MTVWKDDRVTEQPEPTSQMTIDQLAAAVSMTVRNVRAYAGRGLIPAPRLVGRTGYYGPEHVSRLMLIRDLLDRGYTLAAVEKVLERHSTATAGHALDLLNTLEDPLGHEEPEVMSVESLVRLAGVEHEPEFLQRLVEMGLVERIDDEQVRLVRPFVVRAGAKAMALGFDRSSVLALLPLLGEQLHVIAQRFVDEFRAHVWKPFAEAGFPEEKWPAMLDSIRTLLPVASQAVLAVFRDELNNVIEEALGEELGRLAES
ncbi:MAG TPA: MerR family transcriptional regulator [Nocardioidaceae bacterium]|nr:MerR family transcriptional regulator [Nocardioidaceae bacterium]